MKLANVVRLGVNIDHVATVREARKTTYPDPLYAALLAQAAGADGITAHLREDRRHIQDRDIRLLRETLQIRLNLEMGVTNEMIAICLEVRPEACCLVPENRAEVTTEGGLNVAGNFNKINDACQKLGAAGIEVSLFIDPDASQVEAAHACNAPVVEIHTGRYAEAGHDHTLQQTELKHIQTAAKFAKKLGMQVNAGHGLHYHNVQPIAAIPEITELNIGHAIVAHALWVGFPQAIREMKALMDAAR